jgi:hypothetical protein
VGSEPDRDRWRAGAPARRGDAYEERPAGAARGTQRGEAPGARSAAGGLARQDLRMCAADRPTPGAAAGGRARRDASFSPCDPVAKRGVSRCTHAAAHTFAVRRRACGAASVLAASAGLPPARPQAPTEARRTLCAGTHSQRRRRASFSERAHLGALRAAHDTLGARRGARAATTRRGAVSLWREPAGTTLRDCLATDRRSVLHNSLYSYGVFCCWPLADSTPPGLSCAWPTVRECCSAVRLSFIAEPATEVPRRHLDKTKRMDYDEQ